MGNSEQSCVNQPNFKLDNVSYIENTENKIVTTQIILLPHDECKTGNKITITRPIDFTTLELSYTLKDNKGNDIVQKYNYELKNLPKENSDNKENKTKENSDNKERVKAISTSVLVENKTKGYRLIIPVVILLLIIALVILYFYKFHKFRK